MLYHPSIFENPQVFTCKLARRKRGNFKISGWGSKNKLFSKVWLKLITNHLEPTSIVKFRLENEENFEIKTEYFTDDEDWVPEKEGFILENIKTEENLFFCPICSVGYTQRSELKSHITNEHSNYEESQLFNCSNCDYTSSNKGWVKINWVSYERG